MTEEEELKQFLAEFERTHPIPDPIRGQKQVFLMSLIKARHRKGLSQTELAKLLKTQQPAIARIEGGRGNPSLKTLLTIARALDVYLMLE